MRLYEKTACELSSMLRERKCSAAEIYNDIKSRIDECEEKTGAYVTLNDNALEQANAVDKALVEGKELHALAGIPIGIKDNISTKGIRTTCSSKMLENYVPPFNATVIEKINDAGMVITGKTNMDEFAMGASTETSYFHITHNPHNIECVPGGSSGGSASAIASGEAILSLGSDTGGSIRQPSSFCGIVGLKPTYSTVSRYGLIAFASSFDQIGAMGKSVEDVALLHSLICGYDKLDATSKNMEYPDYYKNLCNNVKGLRIGIPKEYFNTGDSTEVKEIVYNAVKVLEQNGAEIREISLPGTEYALSTYYIISSAEASSNLARFDGVRYGYRAKEYNSLSDMYEKTRSEGFGDEVKRRIMLGTFVLSSGFYDDYYKKAKIVQNMISREFSEVFSECDIIATPTVPTTAFKIGENTNDPIKMYSGDVYTVTANIAGLPAISIPCGYDSGNMPVGIQFIANKFCEQTLLNIAYGYEQITGRFDIITKKFQNKGQVCR